ncbi:MAG: preprotein translocase subunit SecG [Pyrinomonadaceae bacterium]
MLAYFLYGLFILSCVVLVVAVLLQPGKADAGALFTSSVSSTAFGPRGTQTLLAKITIGAAILFMLTALMLSLPALTGSRSVLQSTTAEPTPTPAPAATATPQTQTTTVPITAPETNANTNAANADNTNSNKTAPKNANNK